MFTFQTMIMTIMVCLIGWKKNKKGKKSLNFELERK